MKSNFLKYTVIPGILLIAFSSCKKDGWPCKNGDGSIQTVIRSLDGFTEIKNEMEAEVYVTQGSEYEVKVVAQQNLLEEVTTELKGDELQIYSQHCLNKHDPIKIYITLPTLTRVDISGSGYVVTNGNFECNSLSLEVSGSGYFKAQDTIFTENVTTTVSGSGMIDFLGVSQTASAVVSGSGLITMIGNGYSTDTGLPSTFDLTISGSGAVQAFDYPVEVCHFGISGSGVGQVNVSSLLEGSISGSGSLMYMGNPIVNVSTSGSGAVVHVN